MIQKVANVTPTLL